MIICLKIWNNGKKRLFSKLLTFSVVTNPNYIFISFFFYLKTKFCRMSCRFLANFLGFIKNWNNLCRHFGMAQAWPRPGQLLSEYKSVKFLLIESVICLFTDSQARKLFFTVKSVHFHWLNQWKIFFTIKSVNFHWGNQWNLNDLQ